MVGGIVLGGYGGGLGEFECRWEGVGEKAGGAEGFSGADWGER